MREIKFRGKSTEGKWVYGSFFDSGEYAVIYDPSDKTYYQCYLESIGQYTGLKDKNDSEICEGDIVIITYGKWHEEKQGLTRIGKVIFSKNGSFCVKINNSAVEVLFYASKKKDIEVIGNIYENPDLLGATK